jgi:hypothetical protein
VVTSFVINLYLHPFGDGDHWLSTYYHPFGDNKFSLLDLTLILLVMAIFEVDELTIILLVVALKLYSR